MLADGKQATADHQSCILCTGASVGTHGSCDVVCRTGTEPSHTRQTCQQCATGFVSTDGSVCRQCASSSVANEPQAACESCEPGSEPVADKSGCRKCPKARHFSALGDTCTQCPWPNVLGTFNDAEDGTPSRFSRCEPCPAGRGATELS